MGKPVVYVRVSIGRTANSPGIPTAIRILNAFEPKIFPIANENLSALSDLIDTTSSGRDVPSAIIEMLKNPGGTASEIATAIIASIT